jgi:radical SAM superfamily enzyme YgiQ (UPF0313 family)
MILLVNPYITSAERYGREIGDIGGHQMPLGIFYLAANLRRHDFPVEVIDAEARHIVHEEVIEMARKLSPRIIGLTSTTVGFRNARRLAELIRAELPGTIVVIGGPHMTAMPLPTMNTGAFDYGIISEGETPLLQLARFLLLDQGALADIPSLYYRSSGETVHNPKGEYIGEIDTIPIPARDLCPEISVYKPPVGAFRDTPVVSMITSRGCPYLCIFCDNNTFGRKARLHSAAYVVAEIKEIVRTYQAREIAFLDDTFVLDKHRVHEIFDLLDKENIRFQWTCMTRVNNIDFDILRFMASKGCWQIRFGIESGNEDVLKFIKKGITLEQVRNVTEWCRQLGINTTGFFMVGHHIDTESTIGQTIDFALSLPLTDIVATINTPIPGTHSYALAREYGSYSEEDWTSLNYWTPVFVPRGLTRELLLQKQAEFYRRFYGRPQVILRQLRKVRSAKALWMMLKNALLGLRFTRKRTAPPAQSEGI